MVIEAATALLGVVCALTLLCAARLFSILKGIGSERQRHAVAAVSFNATAGGSCLLSRTGQKLKTMIVLGSGGHTKEMLQLTGVLPTDVYCPRIYVTASSDALSIDKAEVLEGGRSGTGPDGSSGSRQLPAPSGPESSYRIVTVPRSREVRQSWPSTCLSSVQALAASFVLVIRHRPDIVLCNGPGTCVPLCAAAFVCRLLLILPRVRIVFVESICRVRSLSLSGMILYRFADYFLVQWPSLCDAYPLASYIGRLL